MVAGAMLSGKSQVGVREGGDCVLRVVMWLGMGVMMLPGGFVSAQTSWRECYDLALAGPKEDRIPGLLDLLARDDSGMAHYLGMVVNQIGPAGAPTLAASLEKGDWYPRWGAAVALEMMGPKAKAALPALEKTFKNEREDICVRVGAARAIARIRGSDPFELYKQIPDVEKRIVKAARDKSTAWRKVFMKRRAARTDSRDKAWTISPRWTYYLATGQNVDIANASIKQLAESGTGDFTVSMNMVRVFVMFHSASSFSPGGLEADTEKAMKKFFFNHCDNITRQTKGRYIPKTARQLAKMDSFAGPVDTANGPLRQAVRAYLSLSVLNGDPEYRLRRFKAGDTVAQRYEAWGRFLHRFLKDWALHGLWIELGSTNYEYRTYSAMLNLVDLAPHKAVRQRARMFLDLALIEIEQISISGLRGGSKSRAKDGGLSSRFNSYLAMLYGERGSLNAQGQIANNSYHPPEAAVLLRKLGPPTATFVIANRRPAETMDGKLKKLSGCFNYAYRTPEYVIGSSMLDANRTYSAASEGRWAGVVFRNLAAVSLEPYLGDRWNIQSRDVLIAQQYKNSSMNRGQPKVVFESSLRKVERDGWVFVDNGQAFAAVRIVRGGYRWQGSAKRTLDLKDPSSPIIIQTGGASVYGSFAKFQEAIVKARLRVSRGTVEYSGPNSARLTFSMATNPFILPIINGRPLGLKLMYNYSSPYMMCRTGSDIVNVRYGTRRWRYDFAKNKITETTR
jgi:hypothetical protein